MLSSSWSKASWLRPYDLARGYPQSPAGRWTLSKLGGVKRTGPSDEGRSRSALRFRYLRADFGLGAVFSFPLAALFFFAAFSFAALATAARNALVSTL